MPPKAKFTKEEVVQAALTVVRGSGFSALTARALAKELNSSARPIFTLFASMEEVIEATERAARDVYNGYIEEGLKEALAFKGVGRAYIRFAREEPKLFCSLFMREYREESASVLPAIDENYGKIMQSITDSYRISEADAEKLYENLWIFSHGIAVLIATGTCDFSEKEVNDMLTEVFTAFMIKIKTERKE